MAILLVSLSLISRSRLLLVRKCMTCTSHHSRSVLTNPIGSCITAIASISSWSIKFGTSSSRPTPTVLLNFYVLAYCIHTILPLGTRSPPESHPHYLGTVAHVQKFRLYIQLSETCVSARVRASYAHLVGGTWACRKAKRPKISWSSRSLSMSSDVNIHDDLRATTYFVRP